MTDARILRKRDAPSYLGMSAKEFDRSVRPHVSVLRIGKRGVGFDRLELDSWLDNQKRLLSGQEVKQCREKPRQVCASGAKSGTSKRSSKGSAFSRALAQAISPKPNAISCGEPNRSAPSGSMVHVAGIRLVKPGQDT